VDVDASQLSSQRPSPRKAIAASQATEATANTTAPLTFESRLRESQPQDTIVAAEGSKAATVATAKDDNALEDFDAAFADNFNGIDWSRLPRYTVTSECGFTLAHDFSTALGKSHLPYVV
jgi:hypothetical protein